MKRPKTLRAYLKALYVLEATPLEDLKGFTKLSEDEQHDISYMGAGLSNDINDQSFKSICEKLKIQQP